MRILSLVFATCLFVAAAEAVPGESNDGPKTVPKDSPKGPHHHHHHMTPLCMDKAILIPESINETMKICYEKTFGPIDHSQPPKERDQKDILCLMVCQAQENDLIDDSGKLQVDEIEKLIEEMLPKEAVAGFTTKVKSCIKEFGSEVKTTKGDCSSVEPAIHCLKKAFMDVCMPNFVPPSPPPTEKKE